MPLHINRLNKYVYDIPDLPGFDINTLKEKPNHDEIIIDENYKTVVKQLCRAVAICHAELMENKDIAKNTLDNYNKRKPSTKGAIISRFDNWFDNLPAPFDRDTLAKNRVLGSFGIVSDSDSEGVLSIESINNLISYIDKVIGVPDSPWRTIISNKYTSRQKGHFGELMHSTTKYTNNIIPLMSNIPAEDIENGKLVNFNDQVFINIIKNLLSVNNYLNGMNNALWTFDGTCKLSCQVACQATCQIACQNCQYNICHDQNCGGWS